MRQAGSRNLAFELCRRKNASIGDFYSAGRLVLRCRHTKMFRHSRSVFFNFQNIHVSRADAGGQKSSSSTASDRRPPILIQIVQSLLLLLAG